MELNKMNQDADQLSKTGETRFQYKNRKQNIRKLIALTILILLVCVLYLVIDLRFSNRKLMMFSLSLRIPKLVVMLITAFAIGASTIVFQSIVNNKIVTPALLGMGDLYSLIHTVVFFFAGSASILAYNTNLSFIVDVVLMVVVASFIYGYLFQKTKFNTMFILLIGTVFGSLFGSLQNSIVRVMDPNEYDALLGTLVASFENINASIVLVSIILLALVAFVLRRDLILLDVITLGKDQAINLGVDYNNVVRRLLMGVTICVSISTAMVGPVTFLGLIVANLSREFLKTYKHKFIITGAALFGMLFLVGGQLIVEHVFTYSVPVSVFISISGGIYFLYLLMRQRSI